MNHEGPEVSLKEMLLVTEGPPAAVWERALEAAFAADEQDGGPDGAAPALVAAGAGTETGVASDADDDAGEDEPDIQGAPTDDFAAAPDPSLDGDVAGFDGWYSEGEVQGGGNDVGY